MLSCFLFLLATFHFHAAYCSSRMQNKLSHTICHFPKFLNITRLSAPTVSLVYDRFTLSPFLSKPPFQTLSFLTTSSLQSAVQADHPHTGYSHSLGKPTPNSASITITTRSSANAEKPVRRI